MNRNEHDKLAVITGKIQQNEDCELLLCNAMGLNVISNALVKQAQHEHFVKCKCDELKAFILARKNVCKSHLPNKGKIADAILGASNLISLAFDCREMPNILLDEKKRLEEKMVNADTVSNTNDSFARHTVVVEANNSSIYTKASELLTNSQWVELSKLIFDPSSLVNQIANDDVVKSKADLLHKVLQIRLTHHIRRRITNRKKKEHWCLQWASKNLSTMAALMTLFGHIKDDIESLGENATLLKSAEYFCQAVDDLEKLQGTYLHYDTNDNKWIRSGKVTGRGFDVRNIEHWKCALARFATASFYLRYPAKASVRASTSSRNGYFDNLSQYVALGFEVGNDEVGGKLAQDYDTVMEVIHV